MGPRGAMALPALRRLVRARQGDGLGGGQFLLQEGAGRPRVALDGGFGDAEQFGDLGHFQAAEEAQFHHLHQACVQRRELADRRVQPHQFLGLRIDRQRLAFERLQRHVLGAAAAALGQARAGVVDHHLAHGLRRGGVDMLAAGVIALAGRELEPGLVHQAAGVEGGAAAVARQLGARDAQQFLVHRAGGRLGESAHGASVNLP